LKQKSAEISTELTDEAAVISVGDDDSEFTNLAASLAEILKHKAVTGYILRSETSAIIDLTEQDKIIEYAVLSSQIFESSAEMSKLFSLADVENVLVEGKNAKMLCMSKAENKISIFLEKTAAHAWIIKRISP
jgi:predicted regulator of Ras-like GTPase activity (Roadblock/LC7/MglB family)